MKPGAVQAFFTEDGNLTEYGDRYIERARARARRAMTETGFDKFERAYQRGYRRGLRQAQQAAT